MIKHLIVTVVFCLFSITGLARDISHPSQEESVLSLSSLDPLMLTYSNILPTNETNGNLRKAINTAQQGTTFIFPIADLYYRLLQFFHNQRPKLAIPIKEVKGEEAEEAIVQFGFHLVGSAHKDAKGFVQERLETAKPFDNAALPAWNIYNYAVFSIAVADFINDPQAWEDGFYNTTQLIQNEFWQGNVTGALRLSARKIHEYRDPFHGALLISSHGARHLPIVYKASPFLIRMSDWVYPVTDLFSVGSLTYDVIYNPSAVQTKLAMMNTIPQKPGEILDVFIGHVYFLAPLRGIMRTAVWGAGKLELGRKWIETLTSIHDFAFTGTVTLPLFKGAFRMAFNAAGASDETAIFLSEVAVTAGGIYLSANPAGFLVYAGLNVVTNPEAYRNGGVNVATAVLGTASEIAVKSASLFSTGATYAYDTVSNIAHSVSNIGSQVTDYAMNLNHNPEDL